jgi:peptide deformylase
MLMAVREILLYNEQSDALRKKSHPVGCFDKRAMALIRDLKDTLNANPDGIGLAAPQINVHQRVVVVCLKGKDGENCELRHPIAFVNPKIVTAVDERKDFDGCLSFPGLYGKTFRPHYLRITGLDENGESFDRIFEGFDAVVIHHEIDHLDGILFVDRIESMEDLYRIHKNETGEFVRASLSDFDFSSHIRE